MRKNIFLVLMCLYTQSCFAQDAKVSKIDFFDYIQPVSTSISNCLLNNKITISYFRRGFDMYETNKQGVGIFFAIPLKEFGVWKREDKSEWKREELWKNNQEKIQNSKTFLSSNKDTLLTYFDVYVFYIKQNDLVIEGSYMIDDGQLRDDYSVKDNAIIYIYKYENNIWININQENIDGKNIRIYGQNFLEKILRKRFPIDEDL